MTNTPRAMELAFRTARFPPGRPLIMAVVSVDQAPGVEPPDVPSLMAAVEQATLNGADLVEFCSDQALSTTRIAEDEQTLSRLVTATRAHYPEVAVGVTTASPEVARQVCGAGADLLRSVHGQDNSTLRDIAASHRTGFVVVSSGDIELPDPQSSVDATNPDVLVDAVAQDLTHNADAAVARGIPASGVLIDPGLDTIADPSAARIILEHLDRLAATGWPVVASLSVVRLFSGIISAQGLQDRTSLAAPTILALLGGAVVFRTHDAATTRRALEPGAFGLE